MKSSSTVSLKRTKVVSGLPTAIPVLQYGWRITYGPPDDEYDQRQFQVKNLAVEVRRADFCAGQLKMWGCVNLGVFQLFCQRFLRVRGRVLSVGRRPFFVGRRPFFIGRRPFFTVAWGNAPGMDVRSDAFGRRPCSSYLSIPDVRFAILDFVAFEKLAELLLKRLRSVMRFLIANILFCIRQMCWAH